MEYRLKDCLESIVDNRGKNPKYFDKEKYPVIDNVLIKNTLYPKIDNATRYIDEKTYNEFLRGYLEKNIPIMTLVGSGIGNVSLAPTKDVAIVQNTIGFKTKENLNSIFLYYWFITKQVELYNLNRGSSQPSIRKTDIENMIINLPKLSVQQKIVEILFTIDSKIEINNKINDNLLEIRNLIYRRWFVDFEFHNKIANLQIEGDLPIGWYYGKIKDIAKELKQRIKDDYENAVVMSPVKTGELVKSDDFFNKQVYSKVINNYKKLDYLDFAYNPARVNIGSIGILKDRVIGAVSPVYVTFRAKDKYHWYLSMLIKDKYVQNRIIQYSSGSVRQALKYIDFSNIECIVPDEKTIKKFNEFYEEIENKIIHNLKQNETLKSIRDILLQKLMNGEIDLDNIEI